MLYTKTSEYAIRALVYLALREDNQLVKSSIVGKAAGVPEAYNSKIFKQLVRAGILNSKPGPNGGVAYAKAPHKISLFDVIEVIDDISTLDNCVMGLDRCTEKNPCPLHHVWSSAKEGMLSKLKTTSIVDLSKQADRFNYNQSRGYRLKGMI